LTTISHSGFRHRVDDLWLTALGQHVARMLQAVLAGVAVLDDLGQHSADAPVRYSVTGLDCGLWSWWKLTGSGR
jgi:hypothetical protein